MELYPEYFDETHRILRDSVRRFTEEHILPYVHEWEERGMFPKELYKMASSAGILGVGYPEEYGGCGGDLFHKIVCVEELMRCGSGGVVAGLCSLDIALPPLLELGSEEQKKRFIPPVLRGERISALGVTEPDAGSDVSNLKTRAKREGDFYIVNGSKTYITSGSRADILTTAVRTGGPGYKGISLLMIESSTPGYSVSEPLKKMGWWASDTAQIFFDDCRVPKENLIGSEGMGFKGIMRNFQRERLFLAVISNTTSQLALDESIKYARQREAFGKRISQFQIIRHMISDMATLVEASREFTYNVAYRINKGIDQVKEISMAKNFASKVCEKVCRDAVQIHGGAGFMREFLVERLYRDSKILSIGGGTYEIMNEIISSKIFDDIKSMDRR